MSMPEAAGPERLNRLRSVFGGEIELASDDGEQDIYRLLAEYRRNGQVYAALQTPAMRKEEEVAFFRVIELDDGSYSLESIGDEDEWETAAEGYDELLFEEG